MAAGGGLPEEIIQVIQSHMPEKDAARTTLLSKSWHAAWSTRPNLSFGQYQFRNRMDEFQRFTKKTMQRYEDLNLNIKSFSLWMKDSHSLAKELILKAIKLGATDLDIGIRSFVLPDEVLESETLTRLSLVGVIVDLHKRKKKEVACSNLKSLRLNSAFVIGGDLFRDLISSCKMIEELKWDVDRNQRIRLENLENLAFNKLDCLRLNGLDVEDALCSHDLCPKFPCLKELVIWDYLSDVVRISSPSLERITIRVSHCRIWDGKFDVPNIRKFKMSSPDVPRLEIKTSSMEWESDIDIDGTLCRIDSASWFARLSQLVRMLSLSRVSLSLSVSTETGINRYVGDGLPIPEVENLRLYRCKVTPEFLDSLFRSCRPNFVKMEENLVLIRREGMWKCLQGCGLGRGRHLLSF